MGRVEFAKIGCDIFEIWTFVWPVGRVVKLLLLLGFGEPREMRSSLIVAGGGCGARVGSPGRPSCLVPFPFPAGGAPVGAVWPPVSPLPLPVARFGLLALASLGLASLGLASLGLASLGLASLGLASRLGLSRLGLSSLASFRLRPLRLGL